jgi:hypothetical protein
MKKRKPPRRLLYRAGFTNDELARLIAEIGPGTLLAAIDRYVGPSRPLGE